MMKGNWKAKIARLVSLMAIIALTVTTPLMAVADDFSDYDTTAGYFNEFDLPEITGGWFDAIDYFPDCSVTLENNSNFELKGRILLANNTYIFIQKTYNSGGYTWPAPPNTTPPPAPIPTDGFLPAAYLTQHVMDPTSMKISPDGTKIALLPGCYGKLYVFDSAILNTDTPVNLDSDPRVTIYTGLGSYIYEMQWVPAVSGASPPVEANRYIAMNEGTWPDVYGSGVYIMDLVTAAYDDIWGAIPGASADVTLDRFGNLYSGNGYSNHPPPPPASLTGEIRMVTFDEWWPAYNQGGVIDYMSSKLIADNILSATQLGFDMDYGVNEDEPGNLHVGGGQLFDSSQPIDVGYAALVNHSVIDDLVYGGRTDPVNIYSTVEMIKLTPDPKEDDSAQSPVSFNPWSRQIAVCWNPSDNGNGGGYVTPGGEEIDFWMPGVIPRLAVYSPGSALTEEYDTDQDGIPNGSDNAYLTPNPGQQDTDGDGYGNICDCDVDNNDVVAGGDFAILQTEWESTGPDTDFDSNGIVAGADFGIFSERWDKEIPFY